MRELKKYDVECIKPVYAELDPEKNKYITETAGFVPLEVKLKRFEEAGIQMQFNAGEFTSTDYRNMYLNPDFEITPEDDFEDIQEKLAAREAFIAELKKSKVGNFEEIADSPSGSAAADEQKNDPVEKSE